MLRGILVIRMEFIRRFPDMVTFRVNRIGVGSNKIYGSVLLEEKIDLGYLKYRRKGKMEVMCGQKKTDP